MQKKHEEVVPPCFKHTLKKKIARAATIVAPDSKSGRDKIRQFSFFRIAFNPRISATTKRTIEEGKIRGY